MNKLLIIGSTKTDRTADVAIAGAAFGRPAHSGSHRNHIVGGFSLLPFRLLPRSESRYADARHSSTGY